MKINPKTHRIQIYNPRKEGNVWKKEYPYSERVYDKGGAWAYVRHLMAAELFKMGMTIQKNVIVAEFNAGINIRAGMKAVFRGQVYEIGGVDEMQFRNTGTKITLTESVDNRKYDGDLFND